MMEKEKLALIPIENIPIGKRVPYGLYVNTIEKFLERENKFCYIQFDDKPQAKNAGVGLRRNIKRLKLESKLMVRQRDDRIYLERLGGKESE